MFTMNRFPFLLPAAFLLLLGAFSMQCGAEIVMSGDGRFDSDSVSNSDANQWRWLSFPGSRFSLNPVPGKELNPTAKWDIAPMGADLPLNLGGFVGQKTLKLRDLLTVRVAGATGEGQPSTSRSTAWFPYKLTFDAAFPRQAKVSGCDFFLDASGTVVRELRFNGPADSVLTFSGKVAGESARWEASQGVVLITGSSYFYAMKLARLDGTGETASAISQEPKIGAADWKVSVPVRTGSEAFGVSFGFATSAEGKDKAIARACDALSIPVATSLAKTKAVMDAYLRKVPRPTHWGVGANNAGVTEAQHRRAYYAAWAFLIQNLIDVLPENPEYPFPQVAVGKPALWDEGEKTSPATCSWESLFGYQWLSFLEPDLAWRAYEGLMTRVDADGKLGGESLPSRKAQTAWILFKNKPDRARLEAVYPALKRYLLWRERNPRWVYGQNAAPDEKDIEFTVSWLVDVNYAIQISQELGIATEKDFWKKKQGAMIEAMRAWFFADNEKIEQFYFTGSKCHGTKDRHINVPMMISTALCCKELPPEMANRVRDYFRSHFKPGAPIGGFPSAKHPDLNLTAYGLLDRNYPEAKVFLQIFLRDAIKAGEFAEQLTNGKADGVKPSLFTPLNIIEFTWLLNNVRYESGTPTVFEFKTPALTTGN